MSCGLRLEGYVRTHAVILLFGLAYQTMLKLYHDRDDPSTVACKPRSAHTSA